MTGHCRRRRQRSGPADQSAHHRHYPARFVCCSVCRVIRAGRTGHKSADGSRETLRPPASHRPSIRRGRLGRPAFDCRHTRLWAGAVAVERRLRPAGGGRSRRSSAWAKVRLADATCCAHPTAATTTKARPRRRQPAARGWPPSSWRRRPFSESRERPAESGALDCRQMDTNSKLALDGDGRRDCAAPGQRQLQSRAIVGIWRAATAGVQPDQVQRPRRRAAHTERNNVRRAGAGVVSLRAQIETPGTQARGALGGGRVSAGPATRAASRRRPRRSPLGGSAPFALAVAPSRPSN
jgi:hypothetical protein